MRVQAETVSRPLGRCHERAGGGIAVAYASARSRTQRRVGPVGQVGRVGQAWFGRALTRQSRSTNQRRLWHARRSFGEGG